MTRTNSQGWKGKLRLDLKSSPPGERAVHHLLVQIEARPATPDESETQTPLNLALVLDASGSMSGHPLAFAKRAARGVVDALVEDDRLSLVSFAEDSIVHTKALSMDTQGRAITHSALWTLRSRGTTDLAAGWLDGCQCVGDLADSGKAMRNHVVVLSDGHANRGLTDPHQLAMHAGEILVRGVATSAVGIGDHYSPHQLAALVEHGGGRLHDAERPEEIIEVLLGELSEVREVVGENLEVEISIPEGVLVENLNGFPEQVTRDKARFSLGSIGAGRKRELVLRVLCRPSEDGEPDAPSTLSLPVKLSWRDPGQTKMRQLSLGKAQIKREGLDEGHYDPKVCAIVARTWQADTVRKVLKLKEQGLVEDARELLSRHLGLFHQYCREFPGGNDLSDELDQLEAALNRELSPRSYKEMYLSSVKHQRSTSDLRSVKRARWSSYLDDGSSGNQSQRGRQGRRARGGRRVPDGIAPGDMLHIKMVGDRRILSGTAPEIVEQMRQLAFGQHNSSLSEYIDWAADNAGTMVGVDLRVAPGTDDERARSFIDQLLVHGLARKVMRPDDRSSQRGPEGAGPVVG